jgi:serine protease
MEQVEVLQLSKDIAYIEENSVVSIDPIFANDSRAPQDDLAGDWGIDRVDQRCLPLNGVDNPCLGKSNDCTGANSVVFVVDTGVRYTHTQFGGRASLAANYATGDPNPYNGDCNGHGTHVAGSVAGSTYGVAKKAVIRSVRVLNCAGSGTTQGVIDGVNYVGNSVVNGKRNILSASVGGGSSTALNSAIGTTADKGVICVVAAGNDNANACNYSPAGAAKAITVGATDKTDTRSSFSNYGTCVNIFAPGSSITSAWFTSDTAINTISGTSMATPIVSGSMAVLSTGVGTSYTTINGYIQSYATRAVVKNAGTGSPNYMAYDRWDDGTTPTC